MKLASSLAALSGKAAPLPEGRGYRSASSVKRRFGDVGEGRGPRAELGANASRFNLIAPQPLPSRRLRWRCPSSRGRPRPSGTPLCIVAGLAATLSPSRKFQAERVSDVLPRDPKRAPRPSGRGGAPLGRRHPPRTTKKPRPIAWPGLFVFVSGRPQWASTASSRSATMLVILIIGLTAGPAVSL